MKSYIFQKRANFIIHLLLIGLLAVGSACNLAGLEGGKNMSGPRAENPTPNPSEETGKAGASSETQTKEPANADNLEGTYVLNNHREGADGYVNNLIVENPENGKMRVSFEGTYFFQANGAETFHDSSAYGTLTLKGSVASGKLIEEGSENGCTIELNFAAERVNLKSSNCDLNVTPDGVYRKGAEDKSKNLDADVVKESRRQNSDDDGNRPFVQYDQSGAPDGIVNLMERDGERVGCEEEILSYTGEVVKVDYNGDYVYEFTLKSDNRRPQKISLVLAAEDRLPFDDVRSIIKRGNHLEVTFINCGNAPIATPTAIYKRL